MLLQWHEGLSVGDHLIDDEHKVWMGLLNALHDAIESNAGDAALASTLTAAMDYTAYHFKHEESLFLQSDYPNKIGHQKLHRKIEGDLSALHTKFHEGQKEGLSIEFMVLLKEWLVHHIQEVDTKYVPYLTKARVA